MLFVELLDVIVDSVQVVERATRLLHDNINQEPQAGPKLVLVHA